MLLNVSIPENCSIMGYIACIENLGANLQGVSDHKLKIKARTAVISYAISIICSGRRHVVNTLYYVICTKFFTVRKSRTVVIAHNN